MGKPLAHLHLAAAALFAVACSRTPSLGRFPSSVALDFPYFEKDCSGTTDTGVRYKVKFLSRETAPGERELRLQVMRNGKFQGAEEETFALDDPDLFHHPKTYKIWRRDGTASIYVEPMSEREAKVMLEGAGEPEQFVAYCTPLHR